MEDGLKTFLALPQKAQELYWKYKNKFLFVAENGHIYNRLENSLGGDFLLLEECESPIEKIMLMALCIAECQYKIIDKYSYGIGILPQIPILKYRVDIDIEIVNLNGWETKELIIECDGHEFHEKTKEQVKKNNKRDYDLKSAGYDILHFSGSEIYNNPMECAQRVFDYIERGINEQR